MKLKEAWGAYDIYTGKVSDLSRQLSFAAIAIVWIFKIDDKGEYNIPGDLTLPLVLIVMSLLLDLCQYIYGAVFWKVVARKKELEHVETEEEFGIYPQWLWPMDILLLLKVAFMIAAYGFLLGFLYVRLLQG